MQLHLNAKEMLVDPLDPAIRYGYLHTQYQMEPIQIPQRLRLLSQRK